jgi:hypothetical protein
MLPKVRENELSAPPLRDFLNEKHSQLVFGLDQRCSGANRTLRRRLRIDGCLDGKGANPVDG